MPFPISHLPRQLTNFYLILTICSVQSSICYFLLESCSIAYWRLCVSDGTAKMKHAQGFIEGTRTHDFVIVVETFRGEGLLPCRKVAPYWNPETRGASWPWQSRRTEVYFLRLWVKLSKATSSFCRWADASLASSKWDEDVLFIIPEIFLKYSQIQNTTVLVPIPR